MSRPTRFEDFRYLGDKRTQCVYDLDAVDDPEVASKIDELLASECFAAFAPDTRGSPQPRVPTGRVRRGRRGLAGANAGAHHGHDVEILLVAMGGGAAVTIDGHPEPLRP